MNQRRAERACGFGGNRSVGGNRRLDGRERVHESPIAAREFPQVPPRGDEPSIHLDPFAGAFQKQPTRRATQTPEPLASLLQAAVRVREHARTHLTEAQPPQLITYLLPATARRGRQDRERPLAVPRAGDLAIDAARGLGEALLSVGCQPVFAAAPVAARSQPAVPSKARYRGAHEAFRESERTRQANQAAEGDHAAARRDRVAEHRDEEGAAAQRPLAAETAQQGPGGGGDGFAHAFRCCVNGAAIFSWIAHGRDTESVVR